MFNSGSSLRLVGMAFILGFSSATNTSPTGFCSLVGRTANWGFLTFLMSFFTSTFGPLLGVLKVLTRALNSGSITNVFSVGGGLCGAKNKVNVCQRFTKDRNILRLLSF